jgi:hypothetical protein
MPLPTAAKEGVGIVRVPSWQAEADLADGHLVRLRLRTRSGTAAPDVSAIAARLLRRSAPSSTYLVERWRGVDAFGFPPRPPMNRTNIQFFNRANRLWYTKPLINRIS